MDELSKEYLITNYNQQESELKQALTQYFPQKDYNAYVTAFKELDISEYAAENYFYEEVGRLYNKKFTNRMWEAALQVFLLGLRYLEAENLAKAADLLKTTSYYLKWHKDTYTQKQQLKKDFENAQTKGRNAKSVQFDLRKQKAKELLLKYSQANTWKSAREAARFIRDEVLAYDNELHEQEKLNRVDKRASHPVRLVKENAEVLFSRWINADPELKALISKPNHKKKT